MQYKNLIFTTALTIFSIIISLGIGEALIRIKNLNMQNYDIEMWKYSRELKQVSKNPILGHEHRPSSRATLQSVSIRINNAGIRGENIGPKQKNIKRILFLGSSITFGWGVEEEKTITQRLEKLLNKNRISYEVINAGIGNYNAVRYSEQFFFKYSQSNPDIIIVQYFVNDAEILKFKGGNWVLGNSQLAVTLWTFFNRYFRSSGENALKKHYKNVYNPSSEGFKSMKAALKRLGDYAHEKNIKIVLAMTPDFHNFKSYPLNFIHEKISTISNDLGFIYIDLLPVFINTDAKRFWNMPEDPHPNALAHELMAKTLYPYLKNL